MPDPEITPEILELIMRTSRVRRCDGVYSLAPRGHRVGIYFQQRRATLLAAALKSRMGREQLSASRIGIIGGGVSGLTFLLALKNEGAHNAFLYEAEGDILSIGAAASHRLVHPNYNRWPLLGSMDVFTSLPVLNWYAGTADNVIRALKAQATTDYQELAMDRIKKAHTAKRIVQRSAEFVDPLRVTFETPRGEHEENFRIVVIAAGFSEERCIKWGCDEYWKRDPETFDVGEHKRPAKIYGAGDGALIDIVRCCAAKPDEAWQIPLGTIALLRPYDAVTMLKDRGNDIPPRQVAFSSIEKKIQSHEESIRCIAWAMTRFDEATVRTYAAEEAFFYRELVGELIKDHKSVVEFLERQLKPIAGDVSLRPTIASALEHPFEPTSAPINKLLLAYLLQTSRITSIRCDKRVAEDELQRWNNESAARRRDRIVICRFGAAKNFPVGNEAPAPRALRVIVSSGGTPIELTDTNTESHLIDALAGVTGGEYLYFDAMPHPLTQARHGLDTAGRTNETRERNKPIIKSFAQEHLDATEVDLRSGNRGVGPKWVVMTALSDDDITSRLRSIGGWDGNFLGAPIVVSPRAGEPPAGEF